MGDISAASRFAPDRSEFASSTRLDSSRAELRPESRADGRTEPRSEPGYSAIDRAPDRVELSDRGRYLAQLAAMPAVRTELVDSIRASLAAGTYETEEKLETTLDALAYDLDLTA